MDAVSIFINLLGRIKVRSSLSTHKKLVQGAGILYVLAYVLGRHRNTRIFYQWPLLSNVGLYALNCIHSHTNNEYTVHIYR